MRRFEEAQGALEGIFSDAAGIRHMHHGDCVSGEFGLERDELKRCCITGIGPERSEVGMELALRCSEAGEKLLIIDMTGDYVGLVSYIPSLRVYRAGRNFQANPFSASRKGFPELIAAAVQAVLKTTRSERTYLERALLLSLSQGKDSPKPSDLLERLLQIEAEAHPRQGQNIDSLRNALWELQDFDRLIPQEAHIPALIDLSKLSSIRVCRLAAIDLFLNIGTFDVTGVVIDPADRIFAKDAPEELSEALESSADELARKGALLIIAASTMSPMPRWITDTLTSEIRCRSVLYDRNQTSKRKLERTDSCGSCSCVAQELLLLISRYSDETRPVRIRRTGFKPVGDEEIEMHMRSLGEGFEMRRESEKRATLLEKIFADRTMHQTAKELMAMIRGGRVPVDAVSKQRSGTLKRVVRMLSRHFLIIEFADGNGTNWYRLTKAGERALDEEEGEDEGEVRV
ncbi:MAG: hypothetical protein ACQXXL_03945 [Candidatus Methanosuratincola sp.]|jgi:hypothetical protein|nr:hypothetical protein [Candidatus Methanosuratincola sp.]